MLIIFSKDKNRAQPLFKSHDHIKKYNGIKSPVEKLTYIKWANHKRYSVCKVGPSWG